jgi:hypothetical protein
MAGAFAGGAAANAVVENNVATDKAIARMGFLSELCDAGNTVRR